MSKKGRTREKLIQIRVNEKEHKTIINNAQNNGMQIAPYVRRAALNPIIVQTDYSIIEAHTKEIAGVRTAINRLVFTIEATNNYLPREIQSVVEMINGIFESENKLLRTLRETRKQQYEQARNAEKTLNKTTGEVSE